MNPFSSKVTFKAMSGTSVQICTEVQNRMFPQKVHPNSPLQLVVGTSGEL